MNKKTKIILLCLFVVMTPMLFIFKKINKNSKDYSNNTTKNNYDFSTLIKKIETDTVNLYNQLIGVNGNIKEVIKDSENVSIEIGYDSLMSSVTCQIDKRHITDFDFYKKNDTINIKGLVTGITIDEDSIFGNTIQMSFCTLNKK